MARKKAEKESVFEGAEIVENVIPEPPDCKDVNAGGIDEPPKRPLKSDPEWHDFVMGHFRDDELFEGRPYVDGLRRVVEILVGNIVDQHVTVVQAPNENNGRWATVIMTIEFGDLYNYNIPTARFSDASDCFIGNVLDENMAKYPTAIAVTRAEGRIYRKALGLKRIIAVEEADTFVQADDTKKITDTQINFINQICKQTNINALSFMRSGTTTFKSIKEIPTDTAANMIQKLASYKNNVSKIPESIKGYAEGWNENA